MTLRKIIQVLVPIIVGTVLIVLIVANQPAHSAPIAEASHLGEELTSDPLIVAASPTAESTAMPDAGLSAQSSLEEIRQAMQTAHLHYETMHVVMLDDDILTGATDIHDIWLSQPLKSFHQTTTIQHLGKDPFELTTVSDGVFTSVYLPEAGENVLFEANVGEPPASAGAHVPGDVPVVVPNWFASMVPTVAMLVMPGDFIRIELAYSEAAIVGEDVLLGRPTVILHTRHELGTGNKLWVDTSTGMILRMERIASDGTVAYSFTITELELDPEIDPALFYVDHSAYDPQRLEELLKPPTG